LLEAGCVAGVASCAMASCVIIHGVSRAGSAIAQVRQNSFLLSIIVSHPILSRESSRCIIIQQED